jgi:hypothetical protein
MENILKKMPLDELYKMYSKVHDTQVKIGAIIKAQEPGLINEKTKLMREFTHVFYNILQIQIYVEIERRAEFIPTSYLINKIYNDAK